MRALLFITVFTAVSLGVGVAHSQTPTAVIVPNGYTQFSDANGKPLADGTVYFYTPGTTTPKTTWQDPYQSVANSNPVTLNGSGEALIWGSGIYRQVVYDVNHNLIWDQLTGGYNCVGGGTVPQGANGALQYNNGGVFGGLPLGASGQVLLANPSGPPTWGVVPAGSVSVSSLTGLGSGVLAALELPLDGTGALVAENGATLNNPIINNATFSPPIGGGGMTAYGQVGSVYMNVVTSGWGYTQGTVVYTGTLMSAYGGTWQQIAQYAAISNVDGAVETMQLFQKVAP